jgi:hypothetical protein
MLYSVSERTMNISSAHVKLKPAGDIGTSAQACNLWLVQQQGLHNGMNPDQVKEVMSAH